MNYSKLTISDIDRLWELQKLYKAEIGEDLPEDAYKERLCEAIANAMHRSFANKGSGCFVPVISPAATKSLRKKEELPDEMEPHCSASAHPGCAA